MKIYIKALFTFRREHNYLASRNITVRVSRVSSQMTSLTCLTSREADYFYRFQLSNDLYICIYFFFTRDFIFRVLGFGAIFRHSVF